jgi:hypothetical protein
MEEDDQTYIDKFIAKLHVEVLSAREQGGGGGGWVAEDEASVNDG